MREPRKDESSCYVTPDLHNAHCADREVAITWKLELPDGFNIGTLRIKNIPKASVRIFCKFIYSTFNDRV